MNLKEAILLSLPLLAGAISAADATEAQTGVNPVSLLSEKHFLIAHGDEATNTAPGVYEIKANQATTRYAFGLAGLKTDLAAARMELANWRAQPKATTDDQAKSEIATLQATIDSLESHQFSLEAQQAARAKACVNGSGPLQCAEFSFQCSQSFDLSASARFVNGIPTASAQSFAGQFGPTTPMFVSAKTDLINAYGTAIPNYTNYRERFDNYIYVGPVSAYSSAAGNGTLTGACGARATARWVGYRTLTETCDYRSLTSTTTYSNCGSSGGIVEGAPR